ncbi:2-ketoarginine methyltransferase [Streptomyces coeruleorubidus]|uniref:2-ketoarginine methyltransferase n=1 Tax=Streptomyces coeruleorubidus TaxID=116188 RepID=UPI0037B9F2DA
MDEGFELRLIEALQPVRGFALAQGIYHLFDSGLYERLADGPQEVSAMSASLGLDASRTSGFLRYLANENYLSLSGDTVSLTDKGRALGPYRPWYELLVGGYAETFQQITDVLHGKGYATRDGRLVGIGSCGMSAYDALPLVRELMSDLPAAPASVVDLGCGDGTFLAGLVDGSGTVTGIGIDPYAPEESPAEGLRFVRSGATDYLREADAPESGPDSSQICLAAFLLQEVLEQEGRGAVVELVRAALRRSGHLAVVEVDHRPADPQVMRHGLGLAYYNPYYLLHVLTEQRLESDAFWRELFQEAGARVVTRRVADPRVDSTGLEVGYLLTRQEGAAQ